MKTGSTRESNYIRGFDGIRAIAVIMVLVGHANITAPLLRNDYPALYGMVAASRGVDIFFVLSGFLITTLLLNERLKYGDIDLRNFFIKRAFRLLPLYYLFCAMVITMTMTANTQYNLGGLAYLLPNVANFTPKEYSSAMTNHMWSLSVEWHFYLFWPFAFVFMAKYGKIGHVIGLMVLIAACVIVLDKAPHYASWTIPAAIPIIIGALSAILLDNRKTAPWSLLPLGLSLYAAPSLMDFSFATSVVRSLGIAFILIWIYRHQYSIVVRCLEVSPLRFVGVISYGLYVWHAFLMGTGPYRASGQNWPPAQEVGFVLLLLVAPLSYYGFERPIQSIQVRLLRRRDKIGGVNQVRSPSAPRPAT